MVSSARWDGANMVLFPERLRTAPKVTKTERVDWGKMAVEGVRWEVNSQRRRTQ